MKPDKSIEHKVLPTGQIIYQPLSPREQAKHDAYYTPGRYFVYDVNATCDVRKAIICIDGVLYDKVLKVQHYSNPGSNPGKAK